MAQKPLYPLRDFSLGINNKDAMNLIPDNALVDAQNAIVGKGYVSKRYGYEPYATLQNAIHKLYEYYRNNGSKEFITVSNLQLYKDSNGVLSAITGALTSNDVRMLTYKNRSIQDVVLLADKGKLKTYNGTAVSEVTAYAPSTAEQTNPGSNDIANLTNVRAMVIKKDRIYIAGHPTVKNRVHFCHHDPQKGYAVFDYFPAPYFFDVGVEDNDEIVELKVFRDAIIILCKRSIWALYGDGVKLADFELNKINVPSGCIAPNSVQIVGNNLFYLSDDHVYSMYQTNEEYVSSQIVSMNIEPILKGISRLDKEKAVGTYFDNKYYLSFPNGTCLVYDVILQSWTRWTNVQANSFLVREGVLYFSSTNGKVYRFNDNIYHDDGVAIPFEIKTKLLDFNTEVQDKKIRRLWVIAKQWDGYNSTFDIRGIVDHYSIVNLAVDSLNIDTNISAKWDEGLWDVGVWDFAELIQKELRIREKGKSIQVIVSNTKLNEPVSIYGLIFEYKTKRA